VNWLLCIPFFELNGRITRVFFDMIAAYNGYQFIDYSITKPHKYIDASIECVQYADSEALQRIILQGLLKWIVVSIGEAMYAVIKPNK